MCDLRPANSEARAWRPKHQRHLPLPRWRATKRVVVGALGHVIPAGMSFTAYDWPPHDGGWEAMNESAERVLEYYEEHRDSPRLPIKAWVDNQLATLEAEAEAHARIPKPDEPPQWPFSTPLPPSARGFAKTPPR